MQNPYDPETGKRNTLENTVRQLGIDAVKIKFENEEFVKQKTLVWIHALPLPTLTLFALEIVRLNH